jgi:hypothetical protein
MIASATTKDRLGLDVFVGEASPVSAIDYLIPSAGANMLALWKGDGVSALLATKKSGLTICSKTGGTATPGNAVCGNGSPWPNLDFIAPGVPNPLCWTGDTTNYNSGGATPPGPFGGTNPGAAIKSALARLAAAKPAPQSYEIQSIVVFTDGGPMCCEQQNGGSDCGTNANGGKPCCADGTTPDTPTPCKDNSASGRTTCDCAYAVYQEGIDQADAAAKAGVDVYTLSFTNGSHPGWVTYAKALTRGRGFELDTTDKNQLSAMMKKIADSIPISLVK